MSLGINRVTLIGHMGRDPEKVEGQQITKIAVATTERWKDKEGEKHEKTEWHRVTFFGHAANSAMKYLYKGAKVYIEGKNVTNEWEKEGQKHYTTEIHVKNYQLLSGLKEGFKPETASEAQEQQQPAASDGFDDDIPF